MPDERKLFQQFLGHYGGPAFAPRAREVQAAFEGMIDACRRQREELLGSVRLRLGRLDALAGSWTALAAFLPDEKRAALAELHTELQPRLKLPMERTSATRVLRRALIELAETVERFNQRWLEFIAGLDLSG